MENLKQLKAFLRVHYDLMLRLARNRLRASGGDMARADAIAQEAIVLAVEEDVSDRSDVFVWLVRTVCRLCSAPPSPTPGD